MQSANDVKLGDGLAVSRGCGLESFFERHGIGAGRISLTTESAQTARGNANIRGIDVAVYIEISSVAMQAFANVVGRPTQSEHVSSAVESESVGGIQALAGNHFIVDRLQARIVGLKWVGMARDRHLPDDIAG
jgi:hypothetical protein